MPIIPTGLFVSAKQNRLWQATVSPETNGAVIIPRFAITIVGITPEYCIMNDNEINVLLDHFVGGLDSTESACVTQKIKTHPQWSKTYKQLNLVFGSLNTIKEQDNQQSAPEGLANKTFQKILEQSNNRHGSSEFIAQKSSSSEQTVNSKSDKRIFSVKPSFLALSACAGFVLVFVLAAVTFNFRNTPTNNLNTNFVDNDSSSGNSPFIAAQPDSNACASFAVTGTSQQPSSSLFFCSNSTPEPLAMVPFNNKNFAINSARQLSSLTPVSEAAASSNESVVTMACPDNIVVITPQPEVRPIFIVQPHLPGELKSIQDVFNQSDVNFVVPVNYQQ